MLFTTIFQLYIGGQFYIGGQLYIGGQFYIGGQLYIWWSVIYWWSVLLVEETGVPGENHRPAISQRQTL